jgi:hypothetical protein
MKFKIVAVIIASLMVLSTAKAENKKTLEEKLFEQQQQLEVLKQEVLLLSKEVKASTPESEKLKQQQEKNWWIKSYGSMLYKTSDVFRNTQDTSPESRSTTDLERVVLEIGYHFDPQWQVEVELEYEHGGTGVALEYDGFEEFGEFETEIEAGGEVLVEKLSIQYQYNDAIKLEFGRIFVPMGLGTELHKPNQYLTTQRHWSEATLIPQVWHETGVNVKAHWQEFSAQALVTTGLNSEYFRTYRWVATGHQKRFEQVNADDLALTLRIDYGNIKSGSGIGASYYTGDTSGNRNNSNNIDGDGNLSIFAMHGVWRYESWLIRGQYIFGELEDSQAITKANKSTPGLQPGNFAQLGSEAESAFIEAAYNTQAIFSLTQPLSVFIAYEYANPIHDVEEGLATSRFDLQEIVFGLNWQPVNNIILKAQIAEQIYAQDNLDNTTSFSLSMGYYFSI